jgi:hypothetical protein
MASTLSIPGTDVRDKNTSGSQQEIKIYDLSIETPVDHETSIKGLGDETSLFYMMLAKFEPMSLNSNL